MAKQPPLLDSRKHRCRCLCDSQRNCIGYVVHERQKQHDLSAPLCGIGYRYTIDDIVSDAEHEMPPQKQSAVLFGKPRFRRLHHAAYSHEAMQTLLIRQLVCLLLAVCRFYTASCRTVSPDNRKAGYSLRAQPS